ncbi:MAG: 16S rRNA (guanine1516-N2)-methyltransferase [Candidatus Azotimanducaceae bacterium]|jgi:16S rRNA (guanine1516-N2)-methyltransferase
MICLSSVIEAELKKSFESNPNANLRYQIDLGDNGVLIQGEQFNINHSFLDQHFLTRLLQPNQSLLKACSNKQRSIKTVLDLTGGWGMDSVMIAHGGRSVTMLEQNRLIYAITAHSLKCAKAHSRLTQTIDRIITLNITGRDFLVQHEGSGEFDCIYLDPMFSNHKSSAKPSKEMQLLQQMTSNVDIELTFSLALKQANNRVVMKRPLKSPPFCDRQPDIVYREKTIRFDVYLTAKN